MKWLLALLLPLFCGRLHSQSISSVSPSSARQGELIVLNVYGSDVDFNQGRGYEVTMRSAESYTWDNRNTVTFGCVLGIVTYTSLWSTLRIPDDALPGKYDVEIKDMDGHVYKGDKLLSVTACEHQ